ncbi:MAG TPA: glycogen synthase GlgA [Gammaproteobacteria bacterium]|nr:glycogen synthase GlgA [Gammaproteobacteria bacterium]
MNILFAASEAFPYIKTGGLGDVVHSLPIALRQLGDDVRLVLPAYRDVMASMESLQDIAWWDLPGVGLTHRVRLLLAKPADNDEFVYLIDVPALFDRPGNPYVNTEGQNWPDNAERFSVFSRAVAQMARGIPGSDWVPDVIHAHDWQTGLVPAFVSMAHPRPKTVFTIHNLAYDGYFSHGDFNSLALPPEWWSPQHVEFHGGFSMLKAGMVFADRTTTVSPTYAREICTPEFGYGFEGILKHLGDRLSGIINGIDLDIWNPANDAFIACNYHFSGNSATERKKWQAAKAENKKDLLLKTGLLDRAKAATTKTGAAAKAEAPLLGFIGRLVEQKGVDLIIEMLPALLTESKASMVILGTGDHLYETELKKLAQQYPDRLHVHIGYSEAFAHRIEAGCDLFIMPSRFEPCGLNQMYSLRYGTPPLVNHTGGLADTVTDTRAETLKNRTATGFVLHDLKAQSLLSTVIRAIDVYRKPSQWAQICETAMSQELGWDTSAGKYQALYREA